MYGIILAFDILQYFKFARKQNGLQGIQERYEECYSDCRPSKSVPATEYANSFGRVLQKFIALPESVH